MISRAFLAEQQFAGNQPSLDGLPQAHVVGDKQIDPWQTQGLSQWLKLVGIQPNTGAEGRLKQSGVGRRDAVPAERVEIGSEQFRLVEATFRDGLPSLAGEHLGVDLALPQDFKWLTLIVVIDAGQSHQRAVAAGLWRNRLLDQIEPLAYASNLARLRNGRGHCCFALAA